MLTYPLPSRSTGAPILPQLRAARQTLRLATRAGLGVWVLVLSVGVWISNPTAAVGQGVAAPRGVMLDPNLPIYRPLDQLSGELKFAGSNTMSHVASVWIDGFQRFYPNITTSIEVNGSRAAVKSVASGEAHVGLLSRTIRTAEVEDFQKRFRFPPTVLTPCLERTAIFVHRSNPIGGLTLAQVDAIFSSTLARGASAPVRTWGQLGLTGAWAARPVIAQGRTKETGSQVFLQESILLGGNYREDLARNRTNIDLIKVVSEDPQAIGFAGLTYASPDVRAVPLAVSDRHPFVAIDSPQADQGLYPLVRPLQLIVRHDPNTELRPVEQEFIKYVFSRLGQEDVIKAGFQAIPARPARVALDAVGLGITR